MSGKKVWLILVLAVMALGIAQVARFMRPHDRLAEARDSLLALRVIADSCGAAVEQGEAALRDYGANVDSMRARVRAYEALDSRGVPQDSFAIYMEAFTAYNDSAAAFQPRADSLEAELERCRELTRQHNLMADSVRRLLARRNQ